MKTKARQNSKERKEAQMKHFSKIAVLLSVVLIMVLVGCSKESSTEPEPKNDNEAIRWLINENPSYFSSQDHYGDEDTTAGKIGMFSPMVNYFWYREILPDPSISITIDIVGDSAYVSRSVEVQGILHLFLSDTFPPDTVDEYTKNFTDTGKRYAIFKRIYSQNEDPLRRRGWRLVMLSGVEIISQGNTVQVDSVRLNSSSYPDTLFTDPLALFTKENTVTLTPEEKCSLTVYTDNDTAHVFLHSWMRHIQHHRSQFKNIGNGVFTGVWYAPSDDPIATKTLHHVAFDMLSNGTLEDTLAAYDANAWLFPYVVNSSY